jgi:hypothetical protein
LAQIAINNPGRIALVEMHVANNSYGMYCPEALQRMYYYPAPVWSGSQWGYYTPYLWYDGDKGGTSSGAWQSLIQNRMQQPAPVTITMWGEWSTITRSGTIYAQFRNDSAAVLNGAVHFVITEDSIYRPVPNGDQWHNHVARDYLPTQAGEAISIPSGDSVTLSRDFAIDTAWNYRQIEFLTWIQNPNMNPADSMKEIWQGAMLDIDSLGIIGIGEYENNQISSGNISLVPNPAANSARLSFTLPAGECYHVVFYDITGRKINTFSGVASGDAESIEWNLRDEQGSRVGSGVYLYRFQSTTLNTCGKVVVK